MQAAIEHIYQLVREADIETAIAQLLVLFKEKAAYREHYRLASLLESDFQKIRQQELNGFLTSGEVQAAENKLQDRVLKLASAVEQPNLLKEIRDAYPPANPGYQNWLLPAAIVLVAGLLYVSGLFGGMASKTFDLSIYFYGDSQKSQLLTGGSVQFMYDGKPETKSPDQEGRVVLSDLRPDLRSDTLYIHPNIANFSTRRISAIIPIKSDHLDVILDLASESLTVRGQVVDQHTNPVADASVRIEEGEALTDSLGEFRLEIPFDPDRIKPVKVMKAGKILYEGDETLGDTPIRLRVRVKDE